MYRAVTIWTISLLVLLSACSNTLLRKCPDGEISWVDALKINDIAYQADNVEPSEDPIQTGKKIGEVEYMLADHACSDHHLRNGDAAYLPIGTEIFEVVGYKPAFRVFAGDRIFQVDDNKQAKTVADLLDVKGKVEKVSYISEEDGSHISDFSDEETAQFMEELLSLEYLGFQKVHSNIKSDDRVFLEIHLKDGPSFQVVYWPEENILNIGVIGTVKLEEIVRSHVGK